MMRNAHARQLLLCAWLLGAASCQDVRSASLGSAAQLAGGDAGSNDAGGVPDLHPDHDGAITPAPDGSLRGSQDDGRSDNKAGIGGSAGAGGAGGRE